MDGVLNENSRTVHKRRRGQPGYQTECGATAHLSGDHLRRVPLSRVLAEADAEKCGRCFEDGRGY